jgi:hypothetical protein
MCAGKPPAGRFDLFAVEGGTAAMCYIFNSLMVNGLLRRGDTIALGVPTFQPYIEIPHLDRYKFKVVNVDAGKELRADGTHSWQYTDEEIDKLADKRIKAFFLVNPSNPPSYAMKASSMQRLVKLVKTRRPDLIIITDDVYGTFVPGFRSLMAELPQNTIGVYSYSKHFGCTGWRLGVIAIHENNIFDKRIAKLSASERVALNRRYNSITLTPLTQSPAIGTASDAIGRLGLPEAETTRLVSYVAVGDALTYVFGTVGAVWFLSRRAPRLLGIDLPAEAKKLENELGIKAERPEILSAYRPFAVRAYRVEGESKHDIDFAADESVERQCRCPRSNLVNFGRQYLIGRHIDDHQQHQQDQQCTRDFCKRRLHACRQRARPPIACASRPP